MSSHMSPSEERTTIIGVMWFAIALIGIALAIAGSSPGIIFGLVIIALLSTFLLMRSAEQGVFAGGKRKRQQPADQLALLMDVLDDDERAEFKATLKQRVLAQFDGSGEGELPLDADSLAALLDHDERDHMASG
ncbi:MAG: hypothetical protein JXA10_14915 [Anaerolineae bacterium]|nr:hypothetical protein [Anaerolineae bacterium]